MIALLRSVILSEMSAGSGVKVSSTSAQTGTQLCSRAPMMLPPDLHGVTMISSPGSGLMAPTHVCIAAVPEVTATTYLTPWRDAHISSNLWTS